MKHEWRKHEKRLYLPKCTPTLIKVDQYKYLCLKGNGNPNDDNFTKSIQCLYNLSYAIRALIKNEFNDEYTVYPLEGLWELTEAGKKKAKLDKNELVYTLMIRQPDLINEAIFHQVLAITKFKKPNPLLNDVYLDEIEDGLSVQIMHIGSYDNEAESFHQLALFLEEHHLQRKSARHREIYLSDARKCSPDRLKTVLRYSVTDNFDKK